MNKILLGLIALSLLGAASNQAVASDIQARGRLEVASSGYYSAVDGHFTISYVNRDLAWGSRVFLHYGFEQQVFRNGDLVPDSQWNRTQEVELSSSSAYAWQGTVIEQLYSRGSSTQFTAIQFAIKIIDVDGKISYDRGSRSPMGYYQAERPTESATCSPFGADNCKLKVETIIKN